MNSDEDLGVACESPGDWTRHRRGAPLYTHWFRSHGINETMNTQLDNKTFIANMML